MSLNPLRSSPQSMTVRRAVSSLCCLLALPVVGSSPAWSQATKSVPTVPARYAPWLEDWETGSWAFGYATEEETRECSRLYWGCYKGQNEYNAGQIGRWPFALNEEAAAFDRKVRTLLSQGVSFFDPDAQCYPTGMPNSARGSIFGGMSMVLQKDRYYLMMNGRDYTQFTVRTIWMDGRPMPPKQPHQYTYNGDSIGRWEGGTLVIETRNIIGANTAIAPNTPKSDNFWVIEKWTPRSADVIDVEVTFKDEERFTAPFTQSFQFKRDPKGEVPVEPEVCIPGVDQRYQPDPETGELKLSGPGMVPLEKAED